MKTILSILFSWVVLTTFSQKETATGEDYKNMALDLCNCINSNAKGLSSGMIETLVEAADNGISIDVIAAEAIEKDPVQGQKDYDILVEVLEGEVKCINGLEKKYKKMYAYDEEMLQKMLVFLAADNNCGLTYAILKMSLTIMEEK